MQEKAKPQRSQLNFYSGDLRLEDNVPAMEYLMLAGGQLEIKKTRNLATFLERFDPDTLRYYLSINMPESHDTDFTWNELWIESTTNSSPPTVILPIAYYLLGSFA